MFYLCITIYLYGDLAIYGAAIAKSLRDVSCTYVPENQTKSNMSESALCWETSTLSREDAYRVFLACFTAAVGPFVFFNVTKTKYLQIFTTIMRWFAFISMVTLASLRLSKGLVAKPPVADFNGIPNMFGVCVYSFMCHHSLPSLGTYVCNILLLPPFENNVALTCAFSQGRYCYPNGGRMSNSCKWQPESLSHQIINSPHTVD